ncbi:MAG: glycosyltransferase family 9 protein [Gemmatimonadetes bacterium]|nr:glycosyltransferase family 9 protein [Gemmatimonadota bacterium]
MLTLPYLHAVRRTLPNVTLDFLTRQEVAAIPKGVRLFDRVFEIGGGRRYRRQLLSALGLLPRLLLGRYQVVLDLQRNRVSRLVRMLLGPTAWVEFDRYSPSPAGERTRRTIEAAGVGVAEVLPGLQLTNPEAGSEQLARGGWRRGNDLVLLNPGGAFPDRQWPVAAYVSFAREFAARRGHPTQFVVTGLPGIRDKTDALKVALGDQMVDLVGHASQVEAAAIIKRCVLAVSEDGGLMHVAWALGVPTIGLFGASRWVWARPHGTFSELVLACTQPDGVCMHGKCEGGWDRSCLADLEPGLVVDAAVELLQRVRTSPRIIRSEGCQPAE